MSHHYLADAVRNRIRLELSYADTDCEVVPQPGQPHPRAGKRFAGVWRGSHGEQGGLMSVNETFGLTVTLTVRINEPFDRLGKNLLQKVSDGVEDMARAIGLMVHGNYSLMNDANTLIYAATASSVAGFVEPLRLLSISTPREVGSDWFCAKPGTRYGMATDIQFGLARRVQSMTSNS